MKKILMLNYEFPPLGGGAGNATKYLLREFSRFDNLEIDLVTSSTDKFRIENFSKNIRIFYIDIGKNGNIHYQSNRDLIIYSWKAFWFCLGMKSRTKYDFVHAFFGIPCGFIAMILRLPYIVSLRGTDVPFHTNRYFWLDFFIFRFLSRLIWHRAVCVVANSNNLAAEAHCTAPQQRISVIANGIDMNLACSQEKLDGVLTLISTSRLIEVKGIKFLLEAFILLLKSYTNVRLLIVGDGPLMEELKSIANEETGIGKVEFLGALPHEEVLGLYHQADVFVLPSLNEGMSNSLLEAMAAGLAVIATDTGGAREIISEENGFIVKKRDSRDIFLALEKFYLDRNKLQSAKKASREKIKDYDWQKVAQSYFGLYGRTKNK